MAASPAPSTNTRAAVDDDVAILANMCEDVRVRDAVRQCNFDQERVVILGGSGFVGLHIARLFLYCGAPPAVLTLFDRLPPLAEHLPPVPPKAGTSVNIVTGDISNRDDVHRAVAGHSIVVHVASYGMSGSEMLHIKRIRQVNYQGTQHVIAACKAHGVKAYVYTSTYNAVFSGKSFANAALDMPYPKAEDFMDEYSRTKSAAEQLVLAADTEGGLRTISLRLAGVYGVGEMRHFPRIIRLVRTGLVQASIGDYKVRQEWVCIANVALGHVLAASALLDSERRPLVAGKAFPISDHHPVNQYRMLEPLWNGIGWPLPRFHLPIWFALCIAWIMDWILILLRPLIVLEPFLTRGEILKVAVEHYFDHTEVIRCLGYKPALPYDEAIATTIASFLLLEKRRKEAALSACSKKFE